MKSLKSFVPSIRARKVLKKPMRPAMLHASVLLFSLIFLHGSLASAQIRQSELFLDDGYGGILTLTTAVGGGNLQFPSGTGTILTTGATGSITTLGMITGGIWDASTIGPAYGGTGLATYTPYAMLAGGTTSTGNLQQVSNVSAISGMVLTYVSSTALPTWQNAAGGGSGILNQTTQQATSNFNLSGIGAAPTFSGEDGTTGGALTVRGGNGSAGAGGQLTLAAGTSTTAGAGVAINAGGAASGTTNQNAGGVIIDPGSSTGTGSGSTITLNAAPVGTTGTTTNSTIAAATISALSSTSAQLQVGTVGSINGNLALASSTASTALTTIQAGAPTTAIIYVLPTTAPTAGEVLSSTAPVSGVATLSWSGGAGAGGGAIFGDGSDGAVTFNGTTTYNSFSSLSGSTYTLTRDIFCSGITVSSGVTIIPNGYRIYCNGTLSNAGIISANGANGGNGTSSLGGLAGVAGNNTGPLGGGVAGGAGGAAGNNNGSPGNSTTNSGGGNGGKGGESTGDNLAGNAGTASLTTTGVGGSSAYHSFTAANTGFIQNTSGILFLVGGAGGSGGGSNTGQGGGGGGAGGGVLLIDSYIISNTGTIEALGGNGGSSNGSNGGVGAGGGGGLILFLTHTSSVGGTVSVAAGTPGTTGSTTSDVAASAGKIITLNN